MPLRSPSADRDSGRAAPRVAHAAQGERRPPAGDAWDGRHARGAFPRLARARSRVWARARQRVAHAQAAIALAGACALLPHASAEPSSPAAPTLVVIPAGIYTPVLRAKSDPEKIAVTAYRLAETPVTNAEFLAFVRAHPKWQRSHVSRLFADTSYLSHWKGDLELGPKAPADAPVVNVSWFAARAFAAAQGDRLPTTAEWERAAEAGFHTINGHTEPEWTHAVEDWLSRPMPDVLPAVKRGSPNFFGVYDLNLLVWEWVDDFNTALVTGESREDNSIERNLFCGAGSLGARDPTDYAAFLRVATRSSLHADYCVPNVGFRCAHDL